MAVQQKKATLHRVWSPPVPDEERQETRTGRALGEMPAPAWHEGGEEIVAALRAFFLTHTVDPLTGEVHTVH